MLKIGLTGGIGSGKSTVAKLFRFLGVEVYSADTEAKELMNINPYLRKEISLLFGEEAYVAGGLNSVFIASKVFSNPSLLEKLNSIVHPVVREDFFEWAKIRSENAYVIQEAAILFESGFSSFFDYNILVKAPLDIRIERVMNRDKVHKSDVEKRINQQFSDEKKAKLSDFQIDNDGFELLIPQVLELHNKFVSLQEF